MKNILNSIVFLSVLVSLAHCSKSSERRVLKIKNKISFLTDSSFFSDVRNIDFKNGNYLISDYKRSQVLELDTGLNLKLVYGSLGEGPGEMKGVSRFFFYDDTIFAISQGKKTIECFKHGIPSSVKTIDIPQGVIGTRFDFRFFVNERNIVLSAPQSGKIVSMLKRDGNQEMSIGELRKFDLPPNSDLFETTTRNINWLFLNEGNIISIGDVVPEIQVMNFYGKIISSQNLYDIPTIRERDYYISQQAFAEHTTYAFFRDAYFDKTKLYLLCISGKEKKALRSNRILIFDLSNSKFRLREEIELPGKWYSSFCVAGDLILAYENTTNELQTMKL